MLSLLVVIVESIGLGAAEGGRVRSTSEALMGSHSGVLP